jgi:hypothetical protein
MVIALNGARETFAGVPSPLIQKEASMRTRHVLIIAEIAVLAMSCPW